MIWRSRAGPGPDGPVLRLRPPAGFGDHLMLTAVIEGLKAERPELRIFLAASQPELFRGNPHIENVQDEGRLKKWARARVGDYLLVSFRSPAERYLQISGHLIDDMYG